jgi:hypothetical protein
VDGAGDDGTSWRPVRLAGDRVSIAHPAGAGFVSVRVTGADTGGNTVHQTVVRAYRYG